MLSVRWLNKKLQKNFNLNNFNCLKETYLRWQMILWWCIKEIKQYLRQYIRHTLQQHQFFYLSILQQRLFFVLATFFRVNNFRQKFSVAEKNLSPSPLGRYLPAKKSTTAPAAGEIGNDIIYVRPKISVSSDWIVASPGNHQSNELLNHAWKELILRLTSLVTLRI